MATIDIIALAWLLWLAAIGFFKGFVYQILTGLSLAAAIILAPWLARYTFNWFQIDSAREGLTFIVASRLVLGAILYFVFTFFAGALDRAMKLSGAKKNALNRGLGAGLGFFKGAVCIAIVALVLSWLPADVLTARAHFVADSRVYQLVKSLQPINADVVVENFDAVMALAADPQADQRIKKKFKEEGLNAAADLEGLRQNHLTPLLQDSNFLKSMSKKGLFEQEQAVRKN